MEDRCACTSPLLREREKCRETMIDPDSLRKEKDNERGKRRETIDPESLRDEKDNEIISAGEEGEESEGASARERLRDCDELKPLQYCLRCWCLLDQSRSYGRRFFSWFVFLLFTLVIPAATSYFIKCSDCDDSGYAFDKLVQIPESILATVAFVCLTRLLRRYGLRRLLFLEQLCDDAVQVQQGYALELHQALKMLSRILLPSFILQLVHKLYLFASHGVSLPLLHGCTSARIRALVNCAFFAAVLLSWLYRTGVFLLVCMLFRLTCYLQILRFDGFRRFLEEYSSDVSIILKEHMRIRHQLLVISHRFRFFILVSLLTMTASQFAALLMMLSSGSRIDFFNAGDLAVCSAVQLTGFVLCLFAAAKITHRAQGTISVATRWHALATCTSYGATYCQREDSPAPTEHSDAAAVNSFSCVDSASDSESSEVFFMFPSKDASAAFEIRQAFVTYLQHNNGGITLFGFVLDRGLLHTLFAFEFSLVMWILSKAIRLS